MRFVRITKGHSKSEPTNRVLPHVYTPYLVITIIPPKINQVLLRRVSRATIRVRVDGRRYITVDSFSANLIVLAEDARLTILLVSCCGISAENACYLELHVFPLRLFIPCLCPLRLFMPCLRRRWLARRSCQPSHVTHEMFDELEEKQK